MKYKIIFTVIFFTSLLYITGCGKFFQRHEIQEDLPEINKKLSIIKDRNKGLEGFKGLGTIKIVHNKKVQTSRVAWISSKDNMLRIEMLGIAGRSNVSIASDNNYIYLSSHFDNTFHKYRSANPSFDNIINIDIKVSDIKELMSGRIPISKYDFSFLEYKDNGSILFLKNRWKGVVEKVFFDPFDKIYKIEVFEQQGMLKYRAIIEKEKKYQQYNIPIELIIENDKHACVELKVSKFWPNISIDPSIFILTP